MAGRAIYVFGRNSDRIFGLRHTSLSQPETALAKNNEIRGDTNSNSNRGFSWTTG
jgi:hypothetical protein